MNIDSYKYFFVVLFPRISMIIFLSCILLAMIIYPSGTYHNHDTTGYLFFENFLSDLGRTTSHGGASNFHSSLLFNMALTFGGVTYIIFYYYLSTLFASVLSKIGSILGIIGAGCLIGVAFTPADLYFDSHIFFNRWVFRLFLLSTFLYSWIVYTSDKISNIYLIGNFIFIFSLALYIAVLIYGPSPHDSHYGLVFQAVAQKLILFNFILSIGVQTEGYKNLF